MEKYIRIGNALVVCIISSVLLSALGVQFIENEEPCPLCLLQRLGMIAAALPLLMNLFIGIRPIHYGMTLIACLFGSSIALRQISLHVCPQFPTFGIPVFGISLYTWSFFVFAATLLSVALFLILESFIKEKKHTLTVTEKKIYPFVLGYLCFITVVNIFATFSQCGLTACVE